MGKKKKNEAPYHTLPQCAVYIYRRTDVHSVVSLQQATYGQPVSNACYLRFCFLFFSCWQDELDKAAAKVNSVETEQGMLTALTQGVAGACKCLTLFTPGHPLKPQEEEPENLSYAVRIIHEIFFFNG